MKRFNSLINSRLFWGALLVSIGLLLLLQNFNLFHFAWELLWTLLLAGGGVAFMVAFLTDRHQWWAIIPGFALLGLAASSGLDAVFPRLGHAIGGALFLGQLGVSFWVIYLLDRERWWAIIPGGTLLTLALVAAVSGSLPGLETGGLFFLGLAATFVLTYLRPGSTERNGWALIPAGVLFALGILTTLSTWSIAKFIWPAALIAVGGYMVYRVLRPR